MPKNISAATLMVLSACIIWGAQPMFVTFVVREFDPIPLVSIRYFTVGVVLLAALAYSGEKLLPPRKAWLPLFLMLPLLEPATPPTKPLRAVMIPSASARSSV